MLVGALVVCGCGAAVGAASSPTPVARPSLFTDDCSLDALTADLDRAEDLYTAARHEARFESAACERLCEAGVLACRVRNALEALRWEHQADRAWSRVTGRARDRCELMGDRCRECTETTGVP